MENTGRLTNRTFSTKAYDQAYFEAAAEEETRAQKRAARARANRKAKDQAMKDLGLTKVRGAMGGTYYE